MKKAYQFSLPDQDNKIHSLKDYAGKKILLYFYPKDDTPGCTKEACNFRDRLDQLTNHGLVVLGVSKDSPESHVKFREKYSLTFPLLSDEQLEAAKGYGVWVEKSMFGKKYMGIQRDSFLIDEDGNIIKHYKKVKPAGHVDEVLKDLEALNNS